MKDIEAIPNKIRVILQMQPPQTRKHVQKLMTRIAALNRFVSKLADRTLPFFTVLRGSTKIEWDPEQKKTFHDLKSYLQPMPTLSSLERSQPLILFISATHTVISGALVQEKEVTKNGKPMKQQFTLYFISEILTGSKRYYSEMENICYAVVLSARKFHHYFKARTISLLTNQPLNDISGNRDSFSQISKWAMELSEQVVDFEKRSAIKSQIIANIVEEWTEPDSHIEGLVPKSPWLIYYDRALGSARARAVIVLISPSGIKLRYAARLHLTSEADKCMNNITEYKTILLGLLKLRVIRVQKCVLRTKSKAYQIINSLPLNHEPENTTELIRME
jgi:hypothetical protein